MAYLGQCDVGREAQCGLHGVAQIEGRKVRPGSWDARRGDCRTRGGVGFQAEGSSSEGLAMRGRRERDVKRYPPMLHGWAHYRRGRGVKRKCGREMREGTRPRCTVGYRHLTRGAGRGGLSPGRLRKIGYYSSLYS
jgi:hypothetical protein